MSEAWYKEYCPKCETINWICNGDESDMSGVDVEGIKCRKCNHIWLLGYEEDNEMLAEINGWDSLEDCFWEVGLESPN